MPNRPLRVALYTRVSTTAQAERNGTEYQLAALEGLAERAEWEIVGVYSDEGHSGRKDSRPELDKMMIHLGRRRFDIVAVWRFDRLARSLSHLVRFLGECRARGVDFVSYSENIDTSTPLGMAMFQIAGAFAELESNLARERVQAGIDNARSKGVTLGRPKSEVTAAEAVLAIEEHGSIRKAAVALGVSPSLVAQRKKTYYEAVETLAL